MRPARLRTLCVEQRRVRRSVGMGVPNAEQFEACTARLILGAHNIQSIELEAIRLRRKVAAADHALDLENGSAAPAGEQTAGFARVVRAREPLQFGARRSGKFESRPGCRRDCRRQRERWRRQRARQRAQRCSPLPAGASRRAPPRFFS